MKGNFVYMFLNEAEEPLYIGISINLVNRIEAQHFKSSNGNLSQECIYETHRILYHQAVSSDDMKVKERYLINTLNPKYNVKMNNNSRFSFDIDFDWKLYSLDKEEILKNKINKSLKNHPTLKNHNHDFINQKPLKISSTKNIVRLCTCTLDYQRLFYDYEYPERNRGSYHGVNDDFFFMKINNDIYIYSMETMDLFHDHEYPGDGNVKYNLKGIKFLNEEYGKNDFVLVDCKEKELMFEKYDDRSWGPEIIRPRQAVFMKFESLKQSGRIENVWIDLIENGLKNIKKLGYWWLIKELLTEDEFEEIENKKREN